MIIMIFMHMLASILIFLHTLYFIKQNIVMLDILGFTI